MTAFTNEAMAAGGETTLPPGGGSPARSASDRFLSATGRRIGAEARELIPLLRDQARESERLTHLTTAAVEALTAAGIFQMTMPLEWGGLALGARDLVEVISTVSEGDGSAGWYAFVGVGLRNALMLDQRAVDEIAANAAGHAGPLVVGASVFATSVGDGRRVDGGWMVKGKWAFGSGCRHAPYALVGVEFDAAHGSGRGVCVLERGQYEIVDDWHVMGLAGTSSNGLRAAEEVFVPDYRFMDLAKVPARLETVRERYEGLAFRQSGPALLLVVSLSGVSVTLGMARGALAAFLEQAPKRKPFNLPYPTVADMPSVHVAAGRARAMIDTAAAVIEGWASEVDARAEQDLGFGPDEESQITLALAYASSLCEEAINSLQRTLGSSTASLNNPIQRFVRDARVLNSHGALRLDPQAEITGRRLLGLEPFLMMGGSVPDVSAR
jgi:alkylation response protein AidB-like acyl-CoA dehydrogenase